MVRTLLIVFVALIAVCGLLYWLAPSSFLLPAGIGIEIVLAAALGGISLVLRPWRAGATKAADQLTRIVLLGYGVIGLFVLGVVAAGYLGLNTPAGGRLTPRELTRMQHIGFYRTVEDESAGSLIFTGDTIGDDAVERSGFQLAMLRAGERVRLQPADWNADHIGAWRITTSPMKRPVRLDGICVNGIAGGWCGPSEQYTFVWPSSAKSRRFVQIRISDTDRRGAERVEFNEGHVTNGHYQAEAPSPVLVDEDFIQDGVLAGELIQRSSMFGHRWQKAAGHALALNESQDGLTGWDVLRSITIVRRVREKASSPLGVLIDGSLSTQGVAVARNGKKIDPRSLIASSSSPALSPSRLSVGVGKGRRTAILIPNVTAGSLKNKQLIATFEVARSYPLPSTTDIAPNESLLLTSGEDQVAMDGYTYPTGNLNHPFYAKARLDPDGRSVSVQDGTSYKVRKPGEQFSLGDNEQGVIVRLEPLASHTQGAGWKAVLILLLLAAAYGHVIWRILPDIRPVHIAWAGLWMGAVTLLTVRLALAYRVSLLPPDDSSAGELVRYREALPMAIWALLIVPMVMVGAAFIAHFDRVGKWLKNLGSPAFLALPALACLIPVIAKATGDGDELFGHIRTNIVVHLLLALGFVALAFHLNRRYKDSEPARLSSWTLPAFVLLSIGAVFSMVIVIGDAGSGLYLIPVLLTIGALWTPIRTRGSKRPPALRWTAVAAVSGVAVLVCMLVFNRGFLIERFPTVENTVVYRLASFDDSDAKLLMNPARVEQLNVRKVTENAEQRWQMLLYASVGASQDRPGYGREPLNNDGMSYATMLSDCAFSTFLLGEHGPWAGALVLLVFVGFLALCLIGAAEAYDDGNWAFIPLVFIGVFYASHSLYMGGANVGAFFFTGQNVPFLSLASWADVAQGAVLLGLATLLLMFDPGRVGHRPPPRGSGWNLLSWGSLGLAFAVWLLVAWHAASLPASRAQDFELDPHVATAMQERARRGELKVLDDLSIEPLKPATLTPIEREYIGRFNMSPDKAVAEGPYTLELNAHRRYDVRVNASVFHVLSPYRRSHGVAWRGAIWARGEGREQPRLFLLTNPLSVSLDPKGVPKVTYLDSKQPIRSANAAILASETNGRPVRYVEAAVEQGRAGLRMSLTPLSGSGWTVFVNGRAIKSKTVLEGNDIVVIEDRTGGFARRYNLIYLGNQPEPIAFVRWRNGFLARHVVGRESLSLAPALGQVGDDVGAHGDLSVTVDVRLQRALQDALRSWVSEPQQRALGFDASDVEAKDASIVVIDTFQGDVVAMPSVPSADSAEAGAEHQLADIPINRRWRYFTNWNLTNHVIGSTVKPLSFCALAEGFRGQLDLENLVVHEHSVDHDGIGGIPFGDERGPYGPVGDHNMRDYLTYSRDWPAIVTASLGLVPEKSQVWNLLKPAGSDSDLSLPRDKKIASAYKIDFRNFPARVIAQDERHPDQWVVRPGAQDTVLFQSLCSLYGAHITSSADYAEIRRKRLDSYLPLFATKRARSNVDRVLPQPVTFDPAQMSRGFDDMRVFMIGGGQNLWNNVSMAESFASLCTGRIVHAHLQSDIPPAFEQPLPTPLNDGHWREQNLFQPLDRAHEVGTSKELRTLLASLPYRTVMKTGTLGEDVDSESLMFTIGVRDGKGGFKPGSTVTAYMFLRNSNLGHHMRKFDLAKRLIPIIANYLGQRSKS